MTRNNCRKRVINHISKKVKKESKHYVSLVSKLYTFKKYMVVQSSHIWPYRYIMCICISRGEVRRSIYLLELSRRSTLFQLGRDVALPSLFSEAYSCRPPPAPAPSSSGPFSGESSLVRENADRERCKHTQIKTHAGLRCRCSGDSGPLESDRQFRQTCSQRSSRQIITAWT